LEPTKPGGDNLTLTGAARESIVSVRGADILVRERGEGDPLLLVNGLGGNVDMWGVVEERLSSVARTIAFDAPGTGRSPLPLWPQSVRDMAELARGLLDELACDRVDVLGYSLGGLVAQELAYAYPERLRRLSLLATACGWGSIPGTREALTLAAMPQRYHSRALYERTKGLLNPVDADAVDRLAALREARFRHPPSILGYMWQLWACATWSSLPWLHRVRVPTLVLHGMADELVPPGNAVLLARLLPNSRLQLVPQGGHLVAFDPRTPAVSFLEEFFRSRHVEESPAWSTGLVVDRDETVEVAFASSVGDEMLGAMSSAYRRYVQHVSQNGNGKPPG
jgi:poly(3-hydroxyoctanoate) depolymerase